MAKFTYVRIIEMVITWEVDAPTLAEAEKAFEDNTEAVKLISEQDGVTTDDWWEDESGDMIKENDDEDNKTGSA